MSSSEERWVDIKGFEGYQISSFGNVKSLKRKVKILCTKTLSANGYLRVGLRMKVDNTYSYENSNKNKPHWKFKTKLKNELIHRLVATHFIENDDPNNKTQVNHINCIKTDNNINNLEWCSASYNQKHAINNGRSKIRKGSECSYAKLTEIIVKDIRDGRYNNLSGKDLAKKLNVSPMTISRIKNNLRWGHVK